MDLGILGKCKKGTISETRLVDVNNGGGPSHFLPSMNPIDLFDVVFRTEGLFACFLSALDFPTRWSLLGTSKEVNSKTTAMLIILLQTKAIPSLWDAYLTMRTETNRRTEGFKFQGNQLGVPFRSFYTNSVNGKMKLRKENTEPFLLQLMIFHNYVGQIDWFFSDISSCDGSRIMEIIGIMGHWQVLEQSTLGQFLTFSNKPNANRFNDDGMAKLVAQRGDVVFWDKIVAADHKGRMQKSLEYVKEEYWLKRRKSANRDASPVRK